MKKALQPILWILGVAILLGVVQYSCMRTGFDEKIIGAEEHHH